MNFLHALMSQFSFELSLALKLTRRRTKYNIIASPNSSVFLQKKIKFKKSPKVPFEGVSQII